jgi:glycine/D-amino acid oxidase-like deaminating enzyme
LARATHQGDPPAAQRLPEVFSQPLSENRLASLLPHRRTYTDANFNVTAIQVAPDGRRILLTARTGTEEGTLREKARRLRRHLVGVFPQLADVRVGRIWSGWCAAPLDRLPKLVRHDGVHYATGYSFMGMPMGTYLGHKAAWQVMGLEQGRTVFSDRGFAHFPLYSGNPWFVPSLMRLSDLHARWVNR